jgi:AAA domain, putative AbiEii toxin, Type IV TA system/AAA domain
VYVRSLEIENLRCFKSASVDLRFPGRDQEATPDLPNVNLLLGNNGSGKTTVLKAVALAVLGPILPSSGFVPYNLVRRRSPDSYICAEQVFHREDLETTPPKNRIEVVVSKLKDQESIGVITDYVGGPGGAFGAWEKLFEDNSPAFFLVGYGATRWAADTSQFEPVASQRKRRGLRYQRVAGLFEEFIGLTPISFWLPRHQAEDADRFEQVRQLLNDLLPAECRFLGEMENDEYLFSHCGIPVPLGALSDGYRAYLGWVSDLLYNISLGAPKGARLREARGVVLVDEIDLHLHPEWQREVVPTVARALPNLQFVLTTHSPIVAGTLSTQNIFVLEMDGAGASTIRQLNEPIHGLNADQILVSSYFGLNTTRAPGAEDELRQLSRRAMSGDSAAALEFLEKLTSGTEEPPAEPVPAARAHRTRTR